MSERKPDVGSTWIAAFAALLMMGGLAGTAGAQDDTGGGAAASCDLTSLPCWSSDKNKCNIKFRNRTGLVEETGCTGRSQSMTTKLKVAARNADKKELGNTLTIEAGATNTINLEKSARESLNDIRIGTPTNTEVAGAVLDCATIRQILSGGGTCKVYIDQNPDKSVVNHSGLDGWLSISCNGGKVCVKGARP